MILNASFCRKANDIRNPYIKLIKGNCDNGVSENAVFLRNSIKTVCLPTTQN